MKHHPFSPVLILLVPLVNSCGKDAPELQAIASALSHRPTSTAYDGKIRAGSIRTRAPDGRVLSSELLGETDLESLEAEVKARPGHFASVEGASFHDGVEEQHKFLVEVTRREAGVASAKNDGVPVAGPPPKVEPRLKQKISEDPNAFISIIIDIERTPQTPLRDEAVADRVTFEGARRGRGPDRAARIVARQQECEGLNVGVLSQLRASGARDLSPFWLTCDVAASVRGAAIESIATHPSVAGVSLSEKLTTTTAEVWDGDNLGIAAGLNGDRFHSAGYWGDAFNSESGQTLRIAILDFAFQVNHPAFLDWAGGPSRVVSSWKCANNPCTSGVDAPGADTHGTNAAGLAAGDVSQDQIAGQTTAWKRDRSALAQESELVLITTGSIADTVRGLQKAVELNADVVVEVFGGADAVCDGDYAGWDEAVFQAYEAGTLVVGSAGNSADPQRTGSCKLTGLAEVPSQFVVGATDDPGLGAYSTAGAASYTSLGGVNITVNGSLISGGFTGVDVVAPGNWGYSLNTSSGYNLSSFGGTSSATPQVAGAAMLVKHFFLSNGYFINDKGRHFTALLAMSDRDGQWGKRDYAFDQKWGGGRFQPRLYANSDHAGGVWGWQSIWYEIGAGQSVNHLVFGAGAEPAGINQFKAYGVFFEQDGVNVADIDMDVYDKDCGAGSVVLGTDTTRDMKSMVRVGSAAASKALCVKLRSYHMPPGEIRRVQLFVYYSADTGMR